MPMHDYANASRIFRSNSYARSPKFKTQFFVSFIKSGSPSADLSYLVKTADLPKFEIDIQDANQYNRKVIIQRQIKYTPVTIKFHDDNTGTLRDFWQQYYNYYYADGTHDDNAFTQSDLYESSRTSSNWGLSGQTTPYLDRIEIYSLVQGQAQKVVLESPIISNFTHDTHDHSEGTGVMESSMTIHYTGVRYEYGQSAGAIPGFSDLIDTNGKSSNGSSYGNEQGSINLKGNDSSNILNTSLDTQQSIYDSNQQNDQSFITDSQLGTIGQNSFLSPSSPYSFPVITPDVVINSDYGSTELSGSYASSDNATVESPNSINSNYPNNSWQYALYQKGYSDNQIASATDYIISSDTASFGPTPNFQQIGETYIQNPKSSNLAQYGTTYFGQARYRPTKINFSNPASATQPVYNGLSWQEQLKSLGYSQAEITNALKFISNLKVTLSTDLTSIAINYINSSKQKGSVTTAIVTKTKKVQQTSSLLGPNFNSTSSTSNTGSYNKI